MLRLTAAFRWQQPKCPPCGSRRLVMLSSDHHHPNQLFHLCLQNGHFHIASAFMSWNSSIENLPSSVRTVWLPEVILERWKNCLILSLISFPVPSYLHWRLEVCFVFLSLLFLSILKPLIDLSSIWGSYQWLCYYFLCLFSQSKWWAPMFTLYLPAVYLAWQRQAGFSFETYYIFSFHRHLFNLFLLYSKVL